MNIKLRKNADNTLTVKVNRQVLGCFNADMFKTDLFDQIRYAVVDAGHYLSNIELTELLNDALSNK